MGAMHTCSTGKSGHSPPTGVFQIVQKDKRHRSSTYGNAPMTIVTTNESSTAANRTSRDFVVIYGWY
jgi:hypothetical protein